jgi:cytochrome c-type biogenesis protein CcmE
MKPERKQKLIKLIAVVSVLMVATLLILYALRQNISLFYTPSQVNNGEMPQQSIVRLGGMVEKGSVERANDSLDVLFTLTDFKTKVRVKYHGVLPTLFREGQGIVARGHLAANNTFVAEEVLAKHDANYMPPEVKEALKNKSKS